MSSRRARKRSERSRRRRVILTVMRDPTKRMDCDWYTVGGRRRVSAMEVYTLLGPGRLYFGMSLPPRKNRKQYKRWFEAVRERGRMKKEQEAILSKIIRAEMRAVNRRRWVA